MPPSARFTAELGPRARPFLLATGAPLSTARSDSTSPNDRSSISTAPSQPTLVTFASTSSGFTFGAFAWLGNRVAP